MTEGTSALEEHHFTNKIVKMFLESNLSLILILLATVVGRCGAGAHAARGRPADRRAAGRRLRQFPRPLGGGSRATGLHAAGKDALSDRRRRVRLFDEPRGPGDHHRPLLRGRGPRAKPGQALQEDRREPGHGPARRDRLGRQAGRDRRRADRDADADQRDADDMRCAAWPRNWPSGWPASRTSRERTSWAGGRECPGAAGPGSHGGAITCRPWKCSGPSRPPTCASTAGDFRANDQRAERRRGRTVHDARATGEPGASASSTAGRCFSRTSPAWRTDPKKSTSYVRHGWGPARGFTKVEGLSRPTLGEAPAALASEAEAELCCRPGRP